MMRSMFSGVSGLRNHQTRMDVIGNNIANVNTIGFKGSRVNFQDILSQNLQGAAAPQGNRGGTNPMQVGLGMSVASIDTIFTDGSTQTTGKQTDLALQGQGFFIVNDGATSYYTRAGNFDFDTSGNYIVPGTGLKVQGWMGVNGVVNTTGPVGDIRIPVGISMPATATTTVDFTKNLNAGAAVGTAFQNSVTVYDSLGTGHMIDVTFTKTAANTWSWQASSGDTSITAGLPATGTVSFNTSGGYTGMTGGPLNLTVTGAAGMTVAVNLSGISQYTSESTITGTSNGNASGTLETVTLDTSGVITGRFSNGLSRSLAQVALATFNNAGGLLKAANNCYAASNNSGVAQVGTANSGGRGSISPGSLEMSNVDLSQQFTDMIVTQRGFQANSKIITTSDEMLQDLVNLKR
ncbi:MAG TPA: flagellar hook-basal body protein [Firmicutes bacterium]|nr:flagellar hook-basal body protein [Bacillota bacterium]